MLPITNVFTLLALPALSVVLADMVALLLTLNGSLIYKTLYTNIFTKRKLSYPFIGKVAS
ncbi:MAG TPA: hypothetical protein GX707_00020 [Epulopiscium sp.]|nr:hypothetical protein [Candidatus Epulonipiscium sp.]